MMMYIDQIQENSNLIAQLDCAVSLELDFRKLYQANSQRNFVIDIKEGRHPIIEKSLPLGENIFRMMFF
jgi:DNA mismatch repair protein MutS